ncbi:MAG: ComEA family DNA-binding protein [Gemmataceae bacterium]
MPDRVPLAAAAAPVAPSALIDSPLAGYSRSTQLALVLLVAGAVLVLGGRAILNGRAAAPAPVVDTRLDINQASRDDLNLLPGIGPALADRIATYREKHGRFRSVDELTKVSGIGKVTLARLRERVAVFDDVPIAAKEDLSRPERSPTSKTSPQSLDPNTASLAELDTLPGIGPKLAQRIIDERGKRAFERPDDLRRVKGIGPKTMDKIRPFLKLGPASAP